MVNSKKIDVMQNMLWVHGQKEVEIVNKPTNRFLN